MVSGKRTVLAFVVAPFAVPLVFLFVFLLPHFSKADEVATRGNFFVGLLLFSIYGVTIAYLCELIFGVAAWIAFKRFGIRSRFAFAIAGAVMGWLVTIITSRGRLADVSNPYFWINLAAGTTSAILFRLVVFSGRQARQPK